MQMGRNREVLRRPQNFVLRRNQCTAWYIFLHGSLYLEWRDMYDNIKSKITSFWNWNRSIFLDRRRASGSFNFQGFWRYNFHLISHFPHRSIGGFRILCLWFCASEKRALDFASRLSKRSTWEAWTTAYFRRLAAFEGPELQISIFGTTNNLCDAGHTTCSVSAFFCKALIKVFEFSRIVALADSRPIISGYMWQVMFSIRSILTKECLNNYLPIKTEWVYSFLTFWKMSVASVREGWIWTISCFDLIFFNILLNPSARVNLAAVGRALLVRFPQAFRSARLQGFRDSIVEPTLPSLFFGIDLYCHWVGFSVTRKFFGLSRHFDSSAHVWRLIPQRTSGAPWRDDVFPFSIGPIFQRPSTRV